MSDSKGAKNIKLTEAERTEKLEKEKSVYIVSYSKRSLLSLLRVPGPKIQINAVYKPENNFEDFKQVSSAERLKDHLDNFKFVSEPAEITVSGRKGIYFIIQYTMRADGKDIAMRSHTYGIPYKDYLLHISMVDMPKQDCSKEFGNIIRSLVIGN